MPDRRPCQGCSYLNTASAEICEACGVPLDEASAPVHPGETLRDPDDLTLPPSPLLRAVLRGEPAAVTTPVVTPPAPLTKATVDQLSPSVDQTALLRALAERLHAPKVEPKIRYAGFFVRVGAFLIDSAVLGAFGLPLAAAGYFGIRAGMLVIGHAEPIATDETLLTLFIAGWFAMATVYFTVLHHSYGQTIGKSAFGLKLHTIDFREVGIVRCFVRALAYAASSSFFAFGFLLVALTPRKRGWHDFIAGTCVVHLTHDEASV